MFSRTKDGRARWSRLAFGLAILAALAVSGAMAAKGGKPGKPGDDPVTNPAITYAVGGVWIMASDGSQQQLTDPGKDGPADTRPVWSPDGSRIAFLRSTDYDLYTVEPDGTNVTLVHDFVTSGDPKPQAYSCLAWSPDGTKILYTRTNEGLRVLDLGSGDVATLTVDGDDPRTGSFGPDLDSGTDGFQGFVAYSGSVDNSPLDPDIHVVRVTTNTDGDLVADLTTTVVLTMTEPQAFPKWSPDGTEIAFLHKSAATEGVRLHVVSFDTANRTFGTPAQVHQGEGVWIGGPTWSPGGDWIAFSERPSGRGKYKPGLYRIRPDGTGLTKVSDDGLIPDWNPAWTDDID